jgi:Lysyl oxidase
VGRAATFVAALGLALVMLTAGRAEAASQMLPDLVQHVPTNVGVNGSNISFDSEVVNTGSGRLWVHGHRSSTSGNMTADQIVQMSDGSTQTIPAIGELHYETAFGHQHWHFEPFDHYQLRRLDGTVVGTDVKQGFCLGDNEAQGGGARFFTDWCRQNHPEALEVTEGISPGWGDIYERNLEGQDIPINPSSAPTGDYDVVHFVNVSAGGGAGPIHESNYGNNFASVEIHLSWSGSTPSLTVLKSCPGTASCATSTPPPGTTTTTTTTSSRTSSRTTTTTSTTRTRTSTSLAPPTPNLQGDRVPPMLFFPKHTTERFRRSLFVYASCNEACRLTAQGRIALRGAATTMHTGKTTVSLPANRQLKVRLTLSRKAYAAIRRTLSQRGRVSVLVRFKAVDAAGNATPSPGAARLKLRR